MRACWKTLLMLAMVLVGACGVSGSSETFCHLLGCVGDVSLEMAMDAVDLDASDHVLIVCTRDDQGEELACSEEERLAAASQHDRWHLVLDGDAPERVASAVVTIVSSGTGETVYSKQIPVSMTSERPNGPDCPPVCWFARIVL